VTSPRRLGDLRPRLLVPTVADAARRLGLSETATRALEAAPLDGVTVATLRLYAQAMGAQVLMTWPTWHERV
jgi:hypothetical protein